MNINCCFKLDMIFRIFFQVVNLIFWFVDICGILDQIIDMVLDMEQGCILVFMKVRFKFKELMFVFILIVGVDIDIYMYMYKY